MDETTDTYDTVEWLLNNVPGNNGRVGVLGVSYPGFLATMAGINPHPAVKAISPQAPMTDTWMGDDFFHQGAFRLSYGFEYAGFMELSNDQSVAAPDRHSGIPTTGTSQLGPLSNVNARVLPRKSAHLERVCRPPGIRRAMAEARGAAAAEVARGPHPDRGRLVGPGRPIRSACHLPGAGAGRHREPEFPGDGALEPRRVAQPVAGKCRWWIRATQGISQRR